MNKKILIISAIVLVIVLIFVAYLFSLDTYHFEGKGKYFGAGINTTPGKYCELVVYSKSGKSIKNIEYKLKGKFGYRSSGTISLEEDGYYIGPLSLYPSRIDSYTIELIWDGKTEIIEMKNVD